MKLIKFTNFFICFVFMSFFCLGLGLNCVLCSHLQIWLNVNQQLLEKKTSFADWSANEIGVSETRILKM